jgi:hypothetical protein
MADDDCDNQFEHQMPSATKKIDTLQTRCLTSRFMGCSYAANVQLGNAGLMKWSAIAELEDAIPSCLQRFGNLSTLQ